MLESFLVGSAADQLNKPFGLDEAGRREETIEHRWWKRVGDAGCKMVGNVSGMFDNKFETHGSTSSQVKVRDIGGWGIEANHGIPSNTVYIKNGRSTEQGMDVHGMYCACKLDDIACFKLMRGVWIHDQKSFSSCNLYG